MTVPQELWKVGLTCSQSFAGIVESALEDMAVSITVMAPPRKNSTHVEALLADKPDSSALQAKIALLAALHKSPAPKVTISPVGSLDWLKKVATDFPPLAIGRWTIYGAAHKHAVKDCRHKLQIDATNAFGTGEHPTTRGCLLMLEKALRNGAFCNILDMGCGSGILAMAYAQATRGRAVAVDLDPDSVAIAHGNVRVNGLDSFIKVGQSHGYASSLVKRHAPYDLIMANIFARPLCEMAKELRQHLKPGGTAILSGLLNQQANAVLAAHRRQGLFLVERMRLGEWSVLMLQ